ncbi:RNA 2'-phosphotransferase [Nocardioides sp. CCNWLW239]|uniref:RNA 2'-phosphotransferase n=1 Tax=Nocardioides sp. CCNWLW239 TaxID=3128902 RepID=UPI00301A9625
MNDVKLSKRLALVLRHRPDSIGIDLDANGWVPIHTLLAALDEHGISCTRADLRRVVANNDKKRYEVDETTDRIRARQGHSVEVDLALEPTVPPPVLFHGTAHRNVSSILATGLNKGGRHHVHLSPDRDTAARVGARRGAYVLFGVDSAAMTSTGQTFWRTENGVWLTDRVDPRYLNLDAPEQRPVPHRQSQP